MHEKREKWHCTSLVQYGIKLAQNNKTCDLIGEVRSEVTVGSAGALKPTKDIFSGMIVCYNVKARNSI